MNIKEFSRDWINAWNAHDLDKILFHYADDVVFRSPVIQKLLGVPGGLIQGKTQLKEYFQTGLNKYPGLHFTLVNCLEGVNNIVLYYTNPLGGHTAESFEFNSEGKVQSVIAAYGD